MPKKKIRKIKNQKKKDLKSFMKDESGFMLKENILKMGIGTLATLSIFASTSQAGPPPPPCDGTYVHTNDRTVQWTGESVGDKKIFPSHTHHSAHCSY